MKAEFDGTYSLAEIAALVKIPLGTLARWRWRGELLTIVDYMLDPTIRKRIDEADARGEEFVRGAVPEARCDLEDVVRLMVLGFLRGQGWDSTQLLRVLRKPYIEPYNTQGDGHTARDQRVMPRFLVIYHEVGKGRMNRVVLDTWEQLGRVLSEQLSAQVLDLRYFREAAQQLLAKVELEREAKAVRRQQPQQQTESEVLV
ncbi:MAG: hypothetical protein WBY44_07295 [Bryobacteraceae bacterium]